MKAPVEADRQHDAGTLGGGDRGFGTRPVERQRLLDMNVLAGGGGSHHLLGMPTMRRRQHDGIDIRIGQRVLEAVEQRDIFLAAIVLCIDPRPGIGRGEFDGVGLAMRRIDQRTAPTPQPDDGRAYGHVTRSRHSRSSCPALCRASTPCFATRQKGVDGRDKPGHDVWMGLRIIRIDFISE
jgi:hypothetical protein